MKGWRSEWKTEEGKEKEKEKEKAARSLFFILDFLWLNKQCESFCSRRLHLWGLQADSLISTNTKPPAGRGGGGGGQEGEADARLGPGRWGRMNPEKEELRPGEVAKRPAVIIAAPVGSLSIRVAVGASDSCGRWRRSRERETVGRREGWGRGDGPFRFLCVRLISQQFSWKNTGSHCGFFRILHKNLETAAASS